MRCKTSEKAEEMGITDTCAGQKGQQPLGSKTIW